MPHQAIGLIETRGLVALVEGTDAMLKAASQNGWLDERRTALESLTSIVRAGADILITYYAKDVAGWLAE